MVIYRNNFKNIESSKELMLVDGIIGQYLRTAHLLTRASQEFSELSEEYPNTNNELFQEHFWDLEYEMEIIFNPLEFILSKIRKILSSNLSTRCASPQIRSTYPGTKSTAKDDKISVTVLFWCNGYKKEQEFSMRVISGLGVSTDSMVESITKILLFEQIMEDFHIQYNSWSSLHMDWLNTLIKNFNRESISYYQSYIQNLLKATLAHNYNFE